ncbi:lytic transglycosylase domain-containing protein [Rhodoferax fermentans]|uniref:Lytic transglycosylase n=1 Tax=Rhodoferax fermentans TaxID=28066 RepID=A0A1T1AT35_RHOFE|nr:transglycosylase SLT domain-containing protein [Rhodoferax fermentans]MBK1682280.1 lytic transglycosylase [Rhodoferax fermentans]OOV07266.1 lytic transglycosylase [Rhodoferax fermentans]
MSLTSSSRLSTWLLMACALAAQAALAQDSTLSATSQRGLFEQALAYENGEGVRRDPLLAANLYCEAARLGDRDAQYNLGWMYANGRGVPRDDGRALFLFQAAAEQGIETARRLADKLADVQPEMPDCMREPEPLPVDVHFASWTPVDYALIAPRTIYKLVHKLAPRFKVEPQLALSIIAAESNFNPQAVSAKNAQGLMQLIPETSQRFNVKNAFDPAQNIRGGLTYLRWLLAYFEGDVALVAAAYNAGEGTVDRYKGVPPYLETRNYVKRVLRSFGGPRHPYDSALSAPSLALKK